MQHAPWRRIMVGLLVATFLIVVSGAIAIEVPSLGLTLCGVGLGTAVFVVWTSPLAAQRAAPERPAVPDAARGGDVAFVLHLLRVGRRQQGGDGTP